MAEYKSKKVLLKDFHKSLITFIVIGSFILAITFSISLPFLISILLLLPWISALSFKAIRIYHVETMEILQDQGVSTKKQQLLYKLQKHILSLLSLSLLFIGLIYFTYLPKYVFFIIIFPWVVDVLHQTVEIYHFEDEDNNTIDRNNNTLLYGQDEHFQLQELRKEWKDSDFV